jgi:hypothetical protein
VYKISEVKTVSEESISDTRAVDGRIMLKVTGKEENVRL